MKQLLLLPSKFGSLAAGWWPLATLLALLGASPAQAQFGAATTYAVGKEPASVAIGDVNGDGRPDIVVANAGDNTVGVRLGLAAGGFATGSTYATGTSISPQVAKLGDLNGDGRLDIVTAGYGSNLVGVLLGQAAGGFAGMSTYAVGGASTSSTLVSGLALGDVNGDGRLDVVAVNSRAYTVAVLLGQASGGFATATSYTIGANPSAVALGDVNADGRLDIVTTNDNSAGAVAAVALGQAGGGFTTASTYPTTGVYGGPVAVGDMNKDGRLDIVTNGFNNGRDVVLYGQAGGGFVAAGTYSTDTNGGGRSVGLALGDVNGDGRLDIVDITGTYTGLNTIDVLLGQASGGFAAASFYASGGTFVIDVALGDVNQDGKLDIVAANSSSNEVSVLLNQAVFLTTAPAAALAAYSPYPNTAHGQATVPLAAGTTTLRLLDALGRELRQQPVVAGAAEATLDLRELPAGFYLVQARGGSGAAVAQRLLVE